MCMKSIVKKSAGPKPKGSNLELLNEFQKLHNFELEDGTNLSQILGYSATSVLTSIENNIKCHYFDYIKRFINSYFKNKYKEEIKDKEYNKQLFRELRKVKNDIIENTNNCDIKYHSWLKGNRYNIVPEEYKNNYYYDVKVNPQKYPQNLENIFLNLQLIRHYLSDFSYINLQ